MTRALPLLVVLMFLPGIVFGQSTDTPSDLRSFPTVRASEVEVGLGTRLMQVASIAFNPEQRNTHWPLFAYPVDAVFSSRACDSFAGTPVETEAAFVRPDEPGVGESTARIFLGIRIRDASQFRDICESENYPATLRGLLPVEYRADADDWYLLSERPLKHIESSFRTSMVPVDAGADKSHAPSVTEIETLQSQR
jgi:hypothetical protein